MLNVKPMGLKFMLKRFAKDGLLKFLGKKDDIYNEQVLCRQSVLAGTNTGLLGSVTSGKT